MREIRTSGSMSGDGKREGDNASTRAHPRLYPQMGKGGVLTPPLPTLLIFHPLSHLAQSRACGTARGARRRDGWEPLCGGVKTPPFRSPDGYKQSVVRNSG